MKKYLLISCLSLCFGFSTPSFTYAGGFPVIDIAGLIQSVLNIQEQVKQFEELYQQTETMVNQLKQTEQQLEAMKGWRNMANIIDNEYLDKVFADAAAIADWLEEWEVILKDGDYFEKTYPNDPAIAQEEREIFEGHLQHLSEWAAETNIYLTRAEARVAELRNLIDVALPAATDQKAVLDLIARTGAENALLTNELIMMLAQQSQRSARSEMTQQQANQIAIEFARGERVPLPPLP
jgi:type IV secretion system protein VirB5